GPVRAGSLAESRPHHVRRQGDGPGGPRGPAGLVGPSRRGPCRLARRRLPALRAHCGPRRLAGPDQQRTAAGPGRGLHRDRPGLLHRGGGPPGAEQHRLSHFLASRTPVGRVNISATGDVRTGTGARRTSNVALKMRAARFGRPARGHTSVTPEEAFRLGGRGTSAEEGTMQRLGTGIGWRPEIADAVEAMPGIDWVEVVAENVCPGHLPESLLRLRERGVTVVPHGVSLGLGGADRPDEARLTALAERAEALRAPLVTEHIAFVRAGGALTASPRLEAGHLLPVPRTRDALDVLCANVRIAQAALPVPLAVENIAALFSWP